MGLIVTFVFLIIPDMPPWRQGLAIALLIFIMLSTEFLSYATERNHDEEDEQTPGKT
jgi:hypothetical protein